MKQPPIYKTYNPWPRRYDTFDEPDEVELPDWATIIKLFWCESAGRYVTIPGASLYKVGS